LISWPPIEPAFVFSIPSRTRPSASRAIFELDPCVIFVPSPSVHTDRVTFSATYGSPVTGARIAAIIPPTDDISMFVCVSVDPPPTIPTAAP